MKEFEVTVSVRNNLLKERRDALGVSRSELARRMRMWPSAYGNLESLKQSPTHKDGTWRDSALRIARFYKVKPDVLFPPSVINVEEPSRSFKADGAELVSLGTRRATMDALEAVNPEDSAAGAELRGLLDGLIDERLTPRERLVVRNHFGMDGPPQTLDDLATTLNRSRERVRHIELMALGKLARPVREAIG